MSPAAATQTDFLHHKKRRRDPVRIVDGKAVCRKCGTTKATTEFYLTTRGTLQGECKSCAKARTSRTRLAAYEKYTARNRESSRTPENRLRRAAWLRRAREESPEKVRARAAVAQEIRMGRMQRQPCQFCGATRAQAHHDDYTRPLDVMWLCQSHHAGRHAFLRYFGHE